MRTIACELDLKDDHTATITLPDDIPAGKHQAVLVIDEHVKDDLRSSEAFDALLSQTSGLWKHGLGFMALMWPAGHGDSCDYTCRSADGF